MKIRKHLNVFVNKALMGGWMKRSDMITSNYSIDLGFYAASPQSSSSQMKWNWWKKSDSMNDIAHCMGIDNNELRINWNHCLNMCNDMKQRLFAFRDKSRTCAQFPMSHWFFLFVYFSTIRITNLMIRRNALIWDWVKFAHYF